ncbi:hydantoinase B/oxoprolinase family protein [Pseudorhodoplanes sp.]|uniref:hydantoinase B/oxoprolinase family protein n=1 Tax=Pseudorhodoplanes sp. TaxID=1934341 RepID=UPI003918E584
MSEIGAVTFEVIRNRLVAISEEMRIALQAVSGSPTVTEASDFFTGLFLPNGAVVSMGFQVSFQAPVCGQVIRHINGKPQLKVKRGDIFIGNDPYIGALHQNDVQMIGPIYAGDEIIAWAGVEAHETDVGGMDFASWCPKAKEVWQEGIRIPCVKLVDQGEIREDVLEMIVTASRLPDQLGLDIRAFIATVNVANRRVGELVERYGAKVVTEVMRRMIASSEARLRARLKELPDGTVHAADFIEHDGHQNILYKIDCKATKKGDTLTLDFSGSSRQAPGFINATRSGLVGGCAGGILTTLGFDIQWNQGLLDPVEIVAPDGLICTAQFPAPVGSATVESIWSVSNAVMAALNKLLATSPKYRHRAQCISDGCMATFNLGGINQYGEPFGLHLMDPLAAGSGAFASKDGIDAGGPITSPVSCIADVERNEQVVPLFYLHRKLTPDTGGAGKFRGGLSAEVALTLGGIEKAMALIMTHGAESPNTAGLSGGWPGSTVVQSMGWGAIEGGLLNDGGRWERFGPKPGLMPMTNRDVFSVIWQGGGGWGDPLEREAADVARDVASGAVSVETAREIYGVVVNGKGADEAATERQREAIRKARVGNFDTDPAKRSAAQPVASLSEGLFVVQDERGTHVVSRAGYILATNSTAWRKGAKSVTFETLPERYRIDLHADLCCTVHYCPASGTQLAVDFHRKGEPPADDLVLDLKTLPELAA